MLINRGEFELSSMNISDSYADFSKMNKGLSRGDSKTAQKKIEVSTEYQAFLYDVLQRTISK